MYRRAEMGIGTLIIFIALLLVAAIAAGVLIQSVGSLQEKALTTGDQAEGQIATNVAVVEVSATDGRDGSVSDFNEIVKLSPGSNAIKIAEVLFTLNTYDSTASLKYKGVSGTFDNSNVGYNTWTEEEVTNNSGTGMLNISADYNHTLLEDYDDDGLDDLFGMTSGGDFVVYFSSGFNYTVPQATATCTGGHHQISGVTVDVKSDEIDDIVISGWCGNNFFNTSAIGLSVNITPKMEGSGYFTVQYLQRGSNPVDGNLQRGDIIKVYYEAPRAIGEDEKVRINFIPKIGTPTLTEFITPEVISTERVYLYP